MGERICYDSPQGPRETWGGKLVENVVQSTARHLMAEAMLRVEAEGFRIVGHSHDEIITEGTHDPAELQRIMCVAPTWAEGLPLEATAYAAKRYQK